MLYSLVGIDSIKLFIAVCSSGENASFITSSLRRDWGVEIDVPSLLVKSKLSRIWRLLLVAKIFDQPYKEKISSYKVKEKLNKTKQNKQTNKKTSDFRTNKQRGKMDI